MCIGKVKNILLYIIVSIIPFLFGYLKVDALEKVKFTAENLNIYPFMEENTFEVTLLSNSVNVVLEHNLENVIWSRGLGQVTLEIGKIHTIFLQNNDGEVEIYHLYPNSDIAKIKNITFQENVKNYTFDKHTYQYWITVNNPVDDLNLTIEPEPGVSYQVSKPPKLDVGDNVIKVEATKNGAVSTTYSYHVYRRERFVYKGFSYTGAVQKFQAPISGTYKFEVWGAQGGEGNVNSAGGKGGYSSGYYYLNEDDIVYVYIGGQGNSGTTKVAGGYNGGGSNDIGTSKKLSGSGGGATDIRTVGGNWNDSGGLDSRLIVAGGGGGSGGRYNNDSAAVYGGAGGGTSGVDGGKSTNANWRGIGGSQTAAGYSPAHASQTMGGFGYGGNGLHDGSSAGGGGGGYYGGGGSFTGGAGGGSGYIGGVISYNGDDPITIAGNQEIPTYDGTGTMIGNTEDGYAKITLMGESATILDILLNITVDKSGMTPNFEENIYEYYLMLGNTETELTINAETKLGEALIMGTGTFTVPAGDKTYSVIMTNTDGTVSIYNINVTRTLNPSAHLKGFKVNGTYYDCTGEPEGEEKIVYNITVPYNTRKIDLELIKLMPGQVIPTDTIYEFEDSTLTKTIVVEAEGNVANQLYEFNFTREKSTKLKSLEIFGGTLLEEFSSDKIEYNLEMSQNGRVLNIDANAWFKEAEITMTEPRYVGIDDKILTIKVELDGIDPTIYTFHIIRLGELPPDPGTSFTCIGDYQEYTAQYPGLYKLETWGAEGGQGTSGSPGGKGGYASGYHYLNAGGKLYVYVGCKGQTGTKKVAGGYNGGGTNDIGKSVASGSGGGATDFRTVSGTWNNIESLRSRIIVAGGGGGGGGFYADPWRNHGGGSGGGLVGKNGKHPSNSSWIGTGGDQTAAGYASAKSSATSGGFGYGGNGLKDASSSGGGGGGYYGGGGSFTGGAGGGSSYIEGLKSFANDYPLTIDGDSLMPTHDGNNVMLGNEGDGYAFIKRVSDSLDEGDAFLDNIVLNNGTIDIDFEPWTLTYNITVDKKVSNLKVEATAKDITSQITGNGTFPLSPGNHQFDIIVTATDGTKKTYTLNVEKEADNDTTPLNILVKNPYSYLCSISDGTCVYNFEPTVIDYKIKVPYQTEKITLQTILRSKYQTVTYKDQNGNVVTDPTFELINTNTIVEVIVTAEDGTEGTYTYEFIRDDRGNNSLSILQILDPTGILLDPIFNQRVYEYSIVVPNETTDITVEAIPENPLSDVEISKDKNLKEGLNDCLVTVTAPNGNRRSYIIHVFREKISNTSLSNLKVYDDSNHEVTLTPTFNKMISDYTSTVDSSVQNIRIDTSAEEGTYIINITSSGTKLNSDGTYKLAVGVNTFEILVTSPEGKTGIHKLTVVKEKNKNAKLLNIEVEGYTLSPEFTKDNFYYTLDIPGNVNSVNVKVTPEEKTTTYTIKGNNSLNNTLNTIVVTSIAEDKSYLVYEITVSKELSDNNFLEKILINGEELENFNKNDLNYTLNLTEKDTSIEVEGIREESTSTVKGNGKYAISKTDPNIITLTVTSEIGADRVYTITVTREANDDLALKEVKNNCGSAVTKVEDTSVGYDYLINVQYETSDIILEGIANSSSSTVTGNGYYPLGIGNNDITLRVTSEAGNYKDYVVRVVRDLSTNDDLSFMFVEEGGLNPHFNETTIFYNVKIPNEKDSVHIEAIPEDKDATVDIIGDTTNLEVGAAREIQVVVTAPKGNQKTYTLSITRQEATTENLALLKLETNRGNLTPTFNPDTLNYELMVENEITDITVTAEALSDDVQVIGTGKYDLRVGKNGISVFVVGEDGVQRDYQIVVTRKKSSDATLSSLVVKSHTLSPTFNKTIENYTLTTSGTYLDFTTIKPTESESTYVVTGNENFQTGENIVTIKVTAPDGEAKKTYTLTVTKTGSKNNNLSSLEVEEYILKPVFHKGVTFYAVEVPNNVNSVIIKAKAEDENATIEGVGLKTIVTGENYFDIVVTSEEGTKKTYKILITKDPSDNNYLATLYSSIGTWNQTFDKTKNTYTIDVDPEDEKIEFYGTLEDANAHVTGLQAHSLRVGENIINITVISESGKTNIYTIKINRPRTYSAYLTDLSVDSYDLDTEFNKELFEYYITVNNETTSLNLHYTKEDPDAEVTIIGNENFEIGMNEVQIKVTRIVSETETLENTYILYVNREMSTNNYLSSITTNEGTLDPVFERETLEYTVEVDREIDKITIDATKEDQSATITTRLGEYDLQLGENIIPITVKSSIGIPRNYKLKVIRKKGTSNYLSSLTVTNLGTTLVLDPTFNKETKEYSVMASKDINFIQIKAVPEDVNATVIGDGLHTLFVGINKFEITVTAEDGSINTYIINITKEVSDNNYLGSLVPSTGTLDPVFNKETMEYTLELGAEDTTLGFTATPESNLAKVIGHEESGVSDGESIRVITVTAENGDTRTYKIKVKKETASESRLARLEVLGYPFTFDPDIFEYNIQVSKSKKKLLESEITAIPKDPNATVNFMGDLELIDGVVNTYIIEVIAKDGYTTQEYTIHITRDSLEYTIRSSIYTIDRNNTQDYVIGMDPKTKKTDFIGNFLNDSETLHVYGSDEEEITDLEKFIGSYMKIKLEIDGYVYDELVIAVRGDLNGDGLVTATDNIQAKAYVLGKKQQNFLVVKIADINQDGLLTSPDIIRIKNYILGERGLNE